VSIYTKRGDSGETDLFGGPRVGKDHVRVEAYGAVDELNAAIGTCVAATEQADLVEILTGIQTRLFEIGAYLASPDARRREKSGIPEPSDESAEALEAHIDAFEVELTPLRRFVVPGGTAAAAGLHVARTVCRRAERRTVVLDREAPLEPSALRFLNRLSDLLFVLARVENARAGVADVEWSGREG
jgi:cob(I)alamin adenosyltransferase